MWSLIRQFAHFYRPYRRLFLLDFCCAVGVAVFEISFPVVVNYVVDTLLPRLDWGLIVAVCVGLLGVYALTGGLQFIVSYWGHMLGISIETDMRRTMFAHLQKLSFRFYDNHKTGHLLARISTDLFDIGEVAHHGPEDAFIAIVTLLATFGVMLTVHAPLAILTLALAVIGYLRQVYPRPLLVAWALFPAVLSLVLLFDTSISFMRATKPAEPEAQADHPHSASFGRNPHWNRTASASPSPSPVARVLTPLWPEAICRPWRLRDTSSAYRA